MVKGDMHGKGGHAWQRGACMAKGGHGWQGVCMAEECAWWGAYVAGETATAAVGTDPTGMHSCCSAALRHCSLNLQKCKTGDSIVLFGRNFGILIPQNYPSDKIKQLF